MKCTVRKMQATLDNPSLNKLDLVVSDYIEAMGSLSVTEQNAISTMWNTLKTLGVKDDIFGIYPVLGDSMLKAKTNMIDVSKYASVGNNAIYSGGVISSNNSSSIVEGNESLTTDLTKQEFTVFAAYKDNSTSSVQNARIAGILNASQTGVMVGGDKRYNNKAVKTMIVNNDSAIATTPGSGTGSQGKVLVSATTKDSTNSGKTLAYNFLGGYDSRSYEEILNSSLFEFTGKPLIGYNSADGQSDCYFLAVLKKSLFKYGSTPTDWETMTNALFNCFQTFLQSCKGFQ